MNLHRECDEMGFSKVHRALIIGQSVSEIKNIIAKLYAASTTLLDYSLLVCGFV